MPRYLGLLAAAQSERSANAREAEEIVLRAEQQLSQAETAGKLDDAKSKEAVAVAEKKLAEAQEKLKAATAALAGSDAKYTPLSDVYPATSSGRRLALARWIASHENPLTARVAVNHIWLRHFGHGIVPTVSDFGQNGRPPSHPALLDWLAAELMEPGASPEAKPWAMKAIHRLLVTSSAYRMASTPSDGDLALDPDNRFLWRMNSRRLEAEAVRDSVLEVAGVLETARGGPELDQGLCLSTHRRSIYYRQAAEKQPEFLQIFDMAGPAEC